MSAWSQQRRHAARGGFPRGSSGGPGRRRTRSRGPSRRTAAAGRSGMCSPTRRGKIFRGDTGDIACDSYNRLEDDVRILSELGVGAYRFSVVLAARAADSAAERSTSPASTTTAGSSSGCAGAGSSRSVTVYHWDLPQALEELRRLGQPRHRPALGELAGARRGARRPGRDVDDDQRATADRRTRATGSAPTRRADATTRWRRRPPITSCSGTGMRSQALRASVSDRRPIGPTMDPHPLRARSTPEAERLADALDAEQNRVYMDPVFKRLLPEDAQTMLRPPETWSRTATWS